MPIFSYLARPKKDARKTLCEELSTLEHCQIIPAAEGVGLLQPGEVVFTVLAAGSAGWWWYRTDAAAHWNVLTDLRIEHLAYAH